MTGGTDRPLVLVALGTDHHPFERAVRWLDAWAAANPRARVLVQHGHSPSPRHAEGLPFLGRDQLHAAMTQAAVVVSHGGPGIITEARRAGRLPVVLARDPELGEHVDDHQLQFAARLDSCGLARVCATAQQLTAAIDAALARPEDFRVAPGSGEETVRAARRAGALIDLLIGAAGEGVGTATEAVTTPAPDDDGWPEVTVVVPTRDRPELLRHTLDAIAAQDYPGRVSSLVVYDQAEPDPGLVHPDGPRPVTVLTNTFTPGLAGARNTGILAADTDLVAFCDDDDTWLPHKLRAQVELLRAHPDTDLVCCGIRVAYGATEAERVLDRNRVRFRDLLRSRLTELHPSTFLLRRDAVVDRSGLVNEEIPGGYGEDYELLLRLARTGVVRNVPEPGVRVLWHRRSHFAERWPTIAVALRWLLAEYPEFRLVRAGHARVAGQVAFAEAAAGHRRAALRWAARTLRARPVEPRGYLAMAVACGLPAGAVLRALHRHGRGL